MQLKTNSNFFKWVEVLNTSPKRSMNRKEAQEKILNIINP